MTPVNVAAVNEWRAALPSIDECDECDGERWVECEDCHGDGVIECDCRHGHSVEHDCEECNGEGVFDCEECERAVVIEDFRVSQVEATELFRTIKQDVAFVRVDGDKLIVHWGIGNATLDNANCEVVGRYNTRQTLLLILGSTCGS